MARIRTIKPEFWLDEDLSELSCETHMFAAALLNHCDDEGYFNANPKLLHAQIFALRELDGTVAVIIQNLENIGYLTLFTGTDGKNYGHVTNFNKHQTINKPKASKIITLKPLPYSDGTTTEQLPLGKEQGTGKGKEQGKENKTSIPAKSPRTKPSFDYSSWGEEPDPIILKDWHAMRSRLKAVPSQTAINQLAKQIQLARQNGYSVNDVLSECVLRGWKGFRFEWLENTHKTNGRSTKSTVGDHNQQAMNEWLANTQPAGLNEIEVNPHEQ
jgi:hypothetical protein